MGAAFPCRVPLLTLAALLAGCAATPRANPPSPPADPSARVKCTILLPLADNAGVAFPAATLDGIFTRLGEQFGGCTLAGTVRGSYRMANGAVAIDRSNEVWVVLPASRLDELRWFVREIGRELRQETMYLEITPSTVEFVPADR